MERPTRRLNEEPPPDEVATNRYNCLRCGTRMIQADFSQYGYVVKTGTSSLAVAFQGGHPIGALVCPECAYTELFTINVEKFLER